MDFPSQAQRDADALAERRRQAEEGRRLALNEVNERKVIGLPGVARPYAAPSRAIGAKPVAATPPKSKGHEAFLKALQGSNADIVVEMISSGRSYFGKLRHSDKYTLTINVTGVRHEGDTTVHPLTEAYDRVLYKHDISEFHTTTAPTFPNKAGARA